MKKIGYLLIVVLTCFLITGCGSDGDDKIIKKKLYFGGNVKTKTKERVLYDGRCQIEIESEY